ncbi:MAG: O-antigen ligase family protein [Parvibaculum sp.]|uniref:O-antigen ligase family protein n=1 Tax=Parvibaculum sp. TaxID=2024848 RepID=UPI0025E902F8|nr:O-antigen ligase family protein [Parvibaculum sp.]MCE9649110.1 O-antigen ligase family protein [Parvibaculum sp.]
MDETISTPRNIETDTVGVWLFRGLIAIVALAPLPLGGNRPLPAALLALGAALLLLPWGLNAAFGRQPVLAVPSALFRLALVLFGLVCLWILVQAMPLPAQWADPAWRETGRILGEAMPGYISVNPNETLSGLMRLLTYAAVFWISFQLCRPPERAEAAIRAAMSIGCVYAIYGLCVFLAGNEWLLIWRKWAYEGSLTSTFVNRNSYATFAGLGLLCAFSIFLGRIRHLLGLKHRRREKIAILIEHIVTGAPWATVCVLALTIALVLTGSRAGTVASFVALLFLLALSLRGNTIRRSHAILVAGMVIAVLCVALLTSGGYLSSRFARDDALLSENDRVAAYGVAIDAIVSAPWTGTGFGTFADVFPAYRSSEGPSGVFWNRAHSTYLENAMGLGLPAAIALNLSILLLAAQCLRGVFTRRRHRSFPAIGVAATLLVGLHATVDFSLEMPAVAIFYAFIMGAAVSQSWTSRT